MAQLGNGKPDVVKAWGTWGAVLCLEIERNRKAGIGDAKNVFSVIEL